MNAAIRWLADFVRGRTDAWPDAGSRFRVLAIASLLVIQGVSALVVEVRQQQQQPLVLYIILYLVSIAAGVALPWRSKAAYIVDVFNTMLGGLAGSSAITFLPVITLVGLDIRAGEPVDSALIGDGFFIAGIAIFALALWKFFPLFESLRRWSKRLESPLYGLVMAGASLIVLWSAVTAVDPSLIFAYVSNTNFDPDLRLGLLLVFVLPIEAYILWSYATLRSRAVRDAFDLP